MKLAVKTITLLIVIVTALNIIDLPVELRFENTAYNYLVVSVLSIALPASLLLASLLALEKEAKVVGYIASFALILPCAFIFTISSNDFRRINDGGSDKSFEKIAELESNGSKYRLYRTNGGATTSFGLVLRSETPLAVGINVVKVVFDKYKAYEGSLILLDDKTIQVRIEPYDRGHQAEIVTLTI